MKKRMFLFLGLTVLAAAAVFAQAKVPKAQTVVDASVPVEQSAILYFPKDSVVLMFNDTKFGTVGPVSVKNLAGKGGSGASQWQIANPILQVPAGKATVVGGITASQINMPIGLRSVTYTFQPGRYYQMATVFNKIGVKDAISKVMSEGLTKGMDWCFIDITDEVNAGKKDYKDKWESMNNNGEMGKDHVIKPIVITDDSAYAPLAPVKATKIFDESVPYEKSAFLYFDKEYQVLKFNDFLYPKVFGTLTGNGKSDGGSAKIVKPVLQIPAGKGTIVASAEKKAFGKSITYNFLPGHHYQAVEAVDIDLSKGMGAAMFGAMKAGVEDRNKRKDWYFIDITYYLKAGLKSFDDMYTFYTANMAIINKDQPRVDWDWIEITVNESDDGTKSLGLKKN